MGIKFQLLEYFGIANGEIFMLIEHKKTGKKYWKYRYGQITKTFKYKDFDSMQEFRNYFKVDLLTSF